MAETSKDPAAVLMGKKRWAGVSDRDKRKHALLMVAARKPRKQAGKRLK